MVTRSLERVLKTIQIDWSGFEILQLLYERYGRGPESIELPPSCLHLRARTTRQAKYKKLCSAPKCPNSDCPSGDLGTLGALRAHLETNTQCLWSYNLSYAILATLAECSGPVSIHDVSLLIPKLFAMNGHFARLDDATEHELFIQTYPGWSLDAPLREWVQSGIVWPPHVRDPQSANRLKTQTHSFIHDKETLRGPHNTQGLDDELWRRLTSSPKDSLRWAEPITYQNSPGGPLSLYDQNRQQREMERIQQTGGDSSIVVKQLEEGSVQRTDGDASIVVKQTTTDGNASIVAQQPKNGSIQQTGRNAPRAAKQPKKASVPRTNGNASGVVKQTKKKGPVRQPAWSKARSPPNRAVGIAQGRQRRRVYFDPVRDAIAYNATLLQDCIVVRG